MSTGEVSRDHGACEPSRAVATAQRKSRPHLVSVEVSTVSSSLGGAAVWLGSMALLPAPVLPKGGAEIAEMGCGVLWVVKGNGQGACAVSAMPPAATSRTMATSAAGMAVPATVMRIDASRRRPLLAMGKA